MLKSLAPRPYPVMSLDDFEEISYRMYQWLFGVLDSNALQRKVKEFCHTEADELRYNQSVVDWVSNWRWACFYSMEARAFRLATIEAMVKQLSGRIELRNHFRRRGLRSYVEDCVTLYGYMVTEGKEWRDTKQFLKKTFTDPKVWEDATFSMWDIREQCYADFVAKKVFHKANFLAYRKLRFIADANRFEPADLMNDLIERAVGYYYHRRPFYDRLYAVNYAKSSIEGRTQQLIQYWTHPDRKRMMEENEHGEYGIWTNRIVSLSEAHSTFTEGELVAAIDKRYREAA